MIGAVGGSMQRLPNLVVAAALSACGPAAQDTAPVDAGASAAFALSGRTCDPRTQLWLSGAQVYTQVVVDGVFDATLGTVTDREGRWTIGDLPASQYGFDVVEIYGHEVLQTHFVVSPGGSAEVVLPEEACFTPPRVDVVTATWADPRGVLQTYAIPTSALVDGASVPAVDAWLAALTITETDVVVMGAGALDVFGPSSPLVDPSTAAGNAATLRGFVEAGGTLVVTDGTYQVIETLWPDKLDFFGDDASPGVAAVGPATTLVTPDGPLPIAEGWPVVVATGAGATTLLAAEVTVDQGLVQTPVPGAALLVTFDAGAGRVVFVAWELDAAWSEGVSDLVFPAVMPHLQG
jgi:hypothetical protein